MRVPRQVRVATAAVSAFAAISTAITGCAADPPRPDPARELTWGQLAHAGLAEDDQLVVYLSTNVMDTARVGYLALVDEDGEARFLRTAAHPDGTVVTRGGTVCATSETTTYRLTRGSAERWDRGGYRGSGHWAGVRADGSCVVVLNSEVGEHHYDTDVYAGPRSEGVRSVVPDIPGPAGQSPDAVWVRNAGLTNPFHDKLKLFRTDLATGTTTEVMSWPTYVEPAHGDTPRITFDDNFGTDLFWHRGRLVYLEDLTTVGPEGEAIDIEPGIRSELRLSEIDPERRTQRSTFLQSSAGGLNAEGPSAVTSRAMRRGHLYAGRIYTGDSQGRILAVDLHTRRVREIGHVSETAQDAVDATATWSRSHLTLLLVSEKHAVTRETYDLTTGKLVASQELRGFSELVDQGMELQSAAVLD